MENSFIYCVSLGFTKFRYSTYQKALKKGQELQSPLTKVTIQPLDTEDPNRVLVVDIATFQMLCSSRDIYSVLRNLAK